MLRCYVCGRRLLHAAASVTTKDGTGHAGPTCARRAGLLPPVVRRGPRMFELGRRSARNDQAQGTLPLQG